MPHGRFELQWPENRLTLVEFGLLSLVEGVFHEHERTTYNVHAVVLAPILL